MSVPDAELAYLEGYLDGRDGSTPAPGPNRDARYRHGWQVGRAEIEGRPIPATISRRRAAEIERAER
jgi:hypothetical protein